MPQIHLKQLALPIVVVDHYLKTKKEYKNLKKQEIQNMFIKANQIKFIFIMVWLMEILRFTKKNGS